MIHYSCDKCGQPIDGPRGVATVTIETTTTDRLRLQVCKDCTASLLPEGSPQHQAVLNVVSWMDQREYKLDV